VYLTKENQVREKKKEKKAVTKVLGLVWERSSLQTGGGAAGSLGV